MCKYEIKPIDIEYLADEWQTERILAIKLLYKNLQKRFLWGINYKIS